MARENAEGKQPWREEERGLAEPLVASDTRVYRYAAQLSAARLRQAWGSEAAVAEAERRLAAECRVVPLPGWVHQATARPQRTGPARGDMTAVV